MGWSRRETIARQFNVPFVFSSNGHQFVFYNSTTGPDLGRSAYRRFPQTGAASAQVADGDQVDLEAPAGQAAADAVRGGKATRRYYQDAAIRAVLEKVARGEKRALLRSPRAPARRSSPRTCCSALDAGQLRKALFICDREELRNQGEAAFKNAFGADAAAVTGQQPAKNARVLIATYQTLDVATTRPTPLS